MVKKSEVTERPVNEKRFCKKCEYYYSEFFTCPICYGEKRAEERLIKILDTLMHDDTECDWGCENYGCGNGYYDALIKRLEGENK